MLIKRLDSVDDMNWKGKLIKSVIYRVITVLLGLLTAYVVTGSVFTAFALSLTTESLQFLNYFAFEMAWSHFDEKRLREEIGREIREKEVNMKLTVGSILDIAKEFSQIDTFVPGVYRSVSSFFKHVLKNKQMKEFHEEITRLADGFEIAHRGRGF